MSAAKLYARNLSIQVPDSMADALQIIANTENSTISAVARDLIERGLKTYRGAN